MRTTVLRSFGLVIAAAAIAAFAHTAAARSKKKKQTGPKPPAACAQLKEKACKARPDCIYTAVAMQEKTKVIRTKASCKPRAGESAKEPAKGPAKK